MKINLKNFNNKKTFLQVFSGCLVVVLIVAFTFNGIMNYNIKQAELKMSEEFHIINNEKEIIAGENARLNQVLSEYEFILSETTMDFGLNLDKEDITKSSNISLAEMKYILKDTGLDGCEYAYLYAEKEYKINAIYLYALTAHESAFGTSNIAESKNNVSGFTAYDNDPYNSARQFASKSESIIETALLLQGEYIGKGMISLKNINSKYASDKTWHTQIDSLAKQTAYELKRWRNE